MNVENNEKTEPENNETPKVNNNKTNIVPVALALIIGLVFGFLIAHARKSDDDNKPTATTTMSMGMHKHTTYAYEGDNPPTVQLMVEEDAKSGWNVHIITTNFEFTPQNVNQENIQGQGHAHLYVNGEKVARVYGEYFHYDGEFDKKATFKVTLNANDHSEITVDGKVVEASEKVTHDHSKSNVHDEDMDKNSSEHDHNK